MGLRIEKEELWRRLSARYKAHLEAEEEDLWPVLLRTLQPVTNFDELAKSYGVESVNTIARAHVSGDGYEDAYVVPEGKRAHIMAIRVVRLTGDMTVNNVHVAPGAGSSLRLQIEAIAATADLQTNLLEGPLVLDEGMALQVHLVAVAADSTFNVILFYALEDSF